MGIQPFFISFEKKGEDFVGFLSIDSLSDSTLNQEKILQVAAKRYSSFIEQALTHIQSLNREKARSKIIKARHVWKLGDMILRLIRDLKRMGLEIDGLYEHLARDLEKKRMWLEKVIIFRNYVSKVSIIPRDSKWSEYSRAPRKSAKLLAKNTQDSTAQKGSKKG